MLRANYVNDRRAKNRIHSKKTIFDVLPKNVQNSSKNGNQRNFTLNKPNYGNKRNQNILPQKSRKSYEDNFPNKRRKNDDEIARLKRLNSEGQSEINGIYMYTY